MESTEGDRMEKPIKTWQELFAGYAGLTKLIVNDSVKHIRELKVEKGNRQHVAIISVYFTILQSAKECICLLEHFPNTVGVPVILRSILESYADMGALIRKPDYVYRMIATYFSQLCYLADNMLKSPQNPLHASLAPTSDPTKMLADAKTQLDKLKDAKHHPLKIKDRFVEAGKTDLHETVYWGLSMEGHNNIAALSKRHLKIADSQIEKLMAFHPKPADEIALYSDVLMGIMADCAVQAHEFYGSARLQHFKELAAAAQAFARRAVESKAVLMAANRPYSQGRETPRS
jgi:hypothetical protein